MVVVLAAMTVAAMVLIPSARARGWVKVKLAKHLFEHRYDYRTEWLRFTGTLGRAGPEAPPLSERIVKAFADIVDAPGGLLLVSDGGRGLAVASATHWPGNCPVPDALTIQRLSGASSRSAAESSSSRPFVAAGQMRATRRSRSRIGCSTNLRSGPASRFSTSSGLSGMVVLAAPEYRRQLDWEDFDLLRTAGDQAASSLAEALGQEALSHAQRFEEFNRRFAFILHDIKNLVSQLSLLARNAERHADNPEFRADMVATLQGSVGKMNELLARLAPHSQASVQRIEAQPLRPILNAAIAAKRRDHEVKLLGDANVGALVDAAALEQAVGHLVQNALDASTGEPVGVRVTSEGASVSIVIADKGVGHGRRLHPQPPVPALRLDQAGRLWDRRLRSTIADHRNGRPAQRRQPARLRKHLHHPSARC